MAFISALLHLSLLAAAHATSPGQGIRRCPSKQITWSPCVLNGTSLPVSCGSLSVPLDYTDRHSNTTLNLEIRKIPAANNPSKGSIFFNFGGPGDSGFGDIAIFGEVLRVLTGGYHDLIVFAPRGTANTIPFSCYNTSIERAIAQLGIVAGNASDVALGQIWGNTQVIADTCYATQNGTGELIGTAFVARDMMCTVDALGEDGMLRYWGYSYGTILGVTAAAMFPDRIDKLILDGVVNPHEYYHNKETEIFTDSDKVLTAFCTACLASPTTCPLAHININNHTTTPATLQTALATLLTTLKYHPVVLPILNTPFLIDYTLVKRLLLLNLYSPATWPSFSSFLAGVLTHNATEVEAYLVRFVSAGPDGGITSGDALPGIKCGDVYDAGRAARLEEMLPTVRGRWNASWAVGDAADYLPLECAQWRMPARERYEGGFDGVRTRGRVLVIGNSGDPVTPLVSAKNVSAGLEGSVVLEHGGYGHSSLAQASVCTALATRAYFVNGTLPEPGTVCKVDVSLFAETDGWDAVIEHFGAAGEGNVKRRIAHGWEKARRLAGLGPVDPVSIIV